jgi:hypothetical protein
VSSWSAIKTAAPTNTAKSTGIYAMVEKITASRNKPTKIEGINFLPARLLIASLIEWRSLMASTQS